MHGLLFVILVPYAKLAFILQLANTENPHGSFIASVRTVLAIEAEISAMEGEDFGAKYGVSPRKVKREIQQACGFVYVMTPKGTPHPS